MSRHLKDEAYRIIKEAITTLQFRPGEPVIEGKLAKSLGISKTPVRNALVRLEQEGLVQTFPFRGTFVAPLNVRRVKETFEVRGALEELALRDLIGRVSPQDVVRLRRVIDEAAVNVHEGHLEESIESIREFHEGLVSLSDNGLLNETYSILSDHLARIRAICGHIPGRVEKSAQEHKAIVDAIEHNDLDGAIVALRLHLGSLIADYLQATEAALATS
jgi:DNA-binding GntR family transcriptional regulator